MFSGSGENRVCFALMASTRLPANAMIIPSEPSNPKSRMAECQPARPLIPRFRLLAPIVSRLKHSPLLLHRIHARLNPRNNEVGNFRELCDDQTESRNSHKARNPEPEG